MITDSINELMTQKPSPNAIKMSTATLAVAKKEMQTYKALKPNQPLGANGYETINGMEIIIDDAMALNAYVLGFYKNGVFTKA